MEANNIYFITNKSGQIETSKENKNSFYSQEGNELTFSKDDSLMIKAIKTIFLFAGSVALGDELKRLKVDYNINELGRGFGAYRVYNLRHKEFGKIVVRL